MLARGARLTELLKQGQYEPLPVARQVMQLYAGTNKDDASKRGWLREIPVADVGRWGREFLEFCEGKFPGLQKSIEEKRELTSEIKTELNRALTEFNGDSRRRPEQRSKQVRGLPRAGAVPSAKAMVKPAGALVFVAVGCRTRSWSTCAASWLWCFPSLPWLLQGRRRKSSTAGRRTAPGWCSSRAPPRTWWSSSSVPTEQGATPTWPSPLPEMDQADERSLSCVRFTDPNRLPLGWRKLLVLGAPSMKSASLRVLSELVTDGESPGFQLESGDKKQVCSSTSVRDDSILGSVWWHPNGRWVMATIDGTLRHCQVTLKASGRPKRK